MIASVPRHVDKADGLGEGIPAEGTGARWIQALLGGLRRWAGAGRLGYLGGDHGFGSR